MVRHSIAAVWLAGATGCGGAVPSVEPAPPGAYVIGDANGDGLADLSDAVFLSSRVFRGGPASSCFSAADVVPDGEINGADPFTLLSAVLPGDADLKAIDPEVCAGAPEPEVPVAAALALILDAPRRAEADSGQIASFTATVLLDTPERAVSAWTLSVVAEGCAVTALSTAGTDADFSNSSSGRRSSQSYDYRALTEGGAVAGLVLDWRADTALDARRDPWALLAITVEATAPSGGCEPCTLRLQDGQRATGPAQRNAVTIDGWTFPIPGSETTVKICSS